MRFLPWCPPFTGSDADDLNVKDILPAAQPTQNMGRNHNSRTHPRRLQRVRGAIKRCQNERF